MSWERPERAASQGRLRFSQTAARIGSSQAQSVAPSLQSTQSHTAHGWRIAPLLQAMSCTLAAITLGAWHLLFSQSAARLVAVMCDAWRCFEQSAALASVNQLHVGSSQARRTAPSLQPISCTVAAVKLGAQRPRFNQSAAPWQRKRSAHSALASVKQLHVGNSHTHGIAPCFNQKAASLQQSSSARDALASIKRLHSDSSQADVWHFLFKQSTSCTVAAVTPGARHARFSQ